MTKKETNDQTIPSLASVVAAADEVRYALGRLNSALRDAAKLKIVAVITKEQAKYEYGEGWKPGTPPKSDPPQFKISRLDFKL